MPGQILNRNQKTESVNGVMLRMKSEITLLVSLVLVLVLAPEVGWGRGETSLDEKERHFTIAVLPILKSKCFACHGSNPGDLKGELDLSSLEKMLNGGESGDPAIVQGDAGKSLLIEAIKWDGLEMPPKENDRLVDRQIKAIEKWIDDGAVWPNVERQAEILKRERLVRVNPDGELVKTSGGLSEDWTYRRYKPEDLWAYRPLREAGELPEDASVDLFVDEKIAAAGIEPAALADARTLIRRATYDLNGLPPKPAEIVAFQQAYREDPEAAWDALVDRLLASPRYGERWGQHWLDVVRYADTSGFSNDFERSNAWRYRDYVIRSFNQDRPYHEFVMEQLAGDEMWAAYVKANYPEKQKTKRSGKQNQGGKKWQKQTQAEPKLTEEERELKSRLLVATGFLRMGPWEHTPMTPNKLSRQNFLDDLVNGVGQTFLSTALRCCKCHDHKFDPIPTRDYYRVYSAFATAQPAEIPAPFSKLENKSQFKWQHRHVSRLLEFAEKRRKELYEKREVASRKWYEDKGIADQYQEFNERIKLPAEAPKPPRDIGLSPAEFGELKVRIQDVGIWRRRLERFQPMVQSVYNGGDYLTNSRRLRRPEKPWELKRVKDNSVSHIYMGGDVYSPGEQVTPGVLSCVGKPTGHPGDEFSLPETAENRRLEFARWVAHDNPLAIRSIVNRIWHYHFGKGLAANPNNFGGTGAKPTHPELLEWLCVEFQKSGGSIKSLHRTIMRSKAYRRSCEHRRLQQLKQKDPANQWLAVFQPRRLSAEEIRDSMLAVSGELNLEYGGLPVRPEIHLEVALQPRMIQASLAPAYLPEPTRKQRNRRSIYAYRVRGLQDPLMVVLDKPNPNESCEIRDNASTTPQVFTLLNSEVVNRRSIAFAQRILRESKNDSDSLRRAFQLLIGEPPSPNIRSYMLSYLKLMSGYHKETKPTRTEFPTFLTRSLVEEFSGETFEYQEWLDVYEDYERDPEAADVGPRVKAWADVCLVLFNSNQFMYVY